jgi:predicted  nucleic acid-binding Zn-ribbon protein
MAESNLKEFSKDIKRHLDEKAAETQKHFDEKAIETQGHFDVVAESLKSEIQTVAEQVGANAEKLTEHSTKFEQLNNRLDAVDMQLDNLQGMRSSVEAMSEDVFKIRVRLESLENKVDKNPNYKDFASLDKRVWRLEQKLRPI